MTREEKIEIIADILEVEPDEVQEDMVLEDFETWDSVAVLSVIAMMDEHFGKYLYFFHFLSNLYPTFLIVVIQSNCNFFLSSFIYTSITRS